MARFLNSRRLSEIRTRSIGVEWRSTQASLLYRDMLLRYRPEAEVDIAYPADPDCNIPDLDEYDAMLWTGSSLTIFDEEPEVTRQIELAREGYQRGLKAFGSCWALQLAAVAAGGACRRNPKGREFGLTHNCIALKLVANTPY